MPGTGVMHINPFFTIIFLANIQQGLSLPKLIRRVSTIPAPLSVPPTTYWEGIDGTWNTFALQVGTPAQTSRVVISTASQESFVINPKACQFTTTEEQCTDLGDSRGGIYVSNNSATWQNEGIFALRVEENLNYSGNGQFGYDNIALGYPGEGMPLLKHQIVGSLAVEDFWYGHFGLHPKTTNFTDLLQNVPSYMTSLYQQRHIPSVSWGYTAGAIYRFARTYASLTLGGYDKSRIVPNDVTFPMGSDNEREFLVYVKSIITEDGSKSLLKTPLYSYIDSTVAEIWLPDDACKLFEREFGLTWDNASKLYFINNTQHDVLVARNANITFSLASAPGAIGDVNITLPYAAFDMTAKPPYRMLKTPQRYFPLRNAMNDTQYTLGRTFLQEAYLIADWERQVFKVSQCAWVPNNQRLIVPIATINATMYTTSQAGRSIVSSGVIAGIAIGVILLTFVLTALLVYVWRQKKQARRKEEEAVENKRQADEELNLSVDRSSTLVMPKHELDASDETTKAIQEKDSEFYKPPFVEAPEDVLFELPGDMPEKPEADSRELSEKEAVRVREHRYNGVEEPGLTSSPISPMSPGDGTNTTNISSPSEGGTLVSARSPISPLADGVLTTEDGSENQSQQLPTRQRVNPADIQIIEDGSAESATGQEAQPTPGELLEGSNGWSHLPERLADPSDDRKRFSFEK